MVGSKVVACLRGRDVWPAWIGILLIGMALAVAAATGSARAGDGWDGGATAGSGDLRDESAAVDQIAQTDELVAFDIPPQPLADALAAFTRQSGLQVAMDRGLVAGLSTQGISGSLAPEDALRRLLAGTGISGRIVDNDSVILEKMAADGSGATVLEPITAEGHRESAAGHVDGIVAKRSATGTKSDTPLIETPQSVSVLTRERLEEQGANSLASALRYSAGTTGEQYGLDLRGYGLRIRGFDASETGLYRDGLILRSPGFASFLTLDPYGAERIEILRGPTSVLYGQNSPGGIVNFVTKRPSPESRYELAGGAGLYDRFEGRFDFTGPIDDRGEWLYRVTGLGLTSDTQVDYVDQDRTFIAPALTWQPNEDTTLTILSHYQHDIQGWTIQFYPAQGTVLPNPNGTIPTHRFTGEPGFDKYELIQYSLGYQFEHRLDDQWTLRQNARYNRLENSQFGVFGAGLQPDLVTLNRYGDAGASSLDGVTVENQAEVTFATGPLDHTWLFGLPPRRTL